MLRNELFEYCERMEIEQHSGCRFLKRPSTPRSFIIICLFVSLFISLVLKFNSKFLDVMNTKLTVACNICAVIY